MLRAVTFLRDLARLDWQGPLPALVLQEHYRAGWFERFRVSGLRQEMLQKPSVVLSVPRSQKQAAL